MTAIVVGLCALMGIGVAASAVLFGRFSSQAPPADRRLEFYEVAYLAGGRARVAEVALAYLVWAGLVDTRPGAGMIAMVTAPRKSVELRPVEAALVATIPPDGRRPTVPLAAAREAARFVEEDLAGLVIPPRFRFIARAPAVGAAILATVISIGVVLSLDEGWGLLAVIPLIGFIVIAMALLGDTRLTKAGRTALTAERRRHTGELSMAEMGVTSLPIESGLYIVALHGRAAMTGGLAPLRRVIR